MVNTNHRFIFGDASSAESNVYISGSGTFRSPSREYDTYQIPGRNGDLHMDRNRYSNVTVSYPCFCVKDFGTNYSDLINRLMSQTGYRRLADDYHPDEYRIARFIGGVEPSTGTQNRSGEFTLEFDCKPQRFLTSGEKVISWTSSQKKVSNPTMFSSRPLIRVYGNGTLAIGSDTLTIASHTSQYMDIDCETMDAFCGDTNLNGYLYLSGNDFPVLKPGETTILCAATISKVECTPRWWRL